jgi:hypothetical protein
VFACPSVLEAGQASHEVAANDAEMVAGGQGGHSVAPGVAENVPGWHMAHSDTLRKDPAGQGICAVPFKMTTKPASTGVHVVLPLTALYELGGHGTHSLATTS